MGRAQSEMSVKGDTNSDSVSSLGSSRDDLQDLATSLGLPSADLLAQDRFQVDRRRLESLIFGNENNPEAATQFFNNIMVDTRTHISWPSRLKLGAKSKKDPHIRVMGRLEGVQIAKTKILASLDTRGSRVTMKIDVSYTDHSHIIGKGGLTIKRVMEETGCHIHFPDSNRSNATEKSNQVSIAGDVSGVENARAKVRELTPLIFCFELPFPGALMMSPPDPSSPFIKSLQDAYSVQVMFRSRQKLNATLVVVKGCEWEVARVKEATQQLMNHMCEALASQVLVHMMVEISPQHHQIVLGRNHENLKGIMQRTSTQIIILDPNDPNIPSLKKSNVTITGSIHNVYIARQQLIGSLPVAIIFDVPEKSIIMDSEQIAELMNSLDVVITTRHKPKQDIISFIVKGIERNVSNIYEARRQLISSNDTPVTANIPPTYLIPNINPTFKNTWQQSNGPGSGFYPNLPSPPVLVAPLLNRIPDNLWGSGQPHYHVLPQHHWPTIYPHNYHSDHLGHFSYSSLSLPELPVYSSLSSNASTLSSPCASPRTVSPVPQNSTDNAKTERKAPGFERYGLTPLEYKQLKLQAVQAIQKNPKETELRIPNPAWAGFGFSQSSPSAYLKEQKLKDEERLNQFDRDCWLNSNQDFPSNLGDFGTSASGSSDVQLSASNYLESLPASTISTISSLNHLDIYSLLVDMGLEKYIQLFKSHEIDLATFRTLTEADLKEIGVKAFGAKRKILLCIAEMNKRQRSPFRGSAAPGAERKNSSSTNSLNENW